MFAKHQLACPNFKSTLEAFNRNNAVLCTEVRLLQKKVVLLAVCCALFVLKDAASDASTNKCKKEKKALRDISTKQDGNFL